VLLHPRRGRRRVAGLPDQDPYRSKQLAAGGGTRAAVSVRHRRRVALVPEPSGPRRQRAGALDQATGSTATRGARAVAGGCLN
jgi:hypothetical protein